MFLFVQENLPGGVLDITDAALVFGDDCFRLNASLKHFEHMPSLEELP